MTSKNTGKKYTTEYSDLTDKELRDLLVIHGRVVHRASPTQIARVFSDAKISREKVYKILKKAGQK